MFGVIFGVIIVGILSIVFTVIGYLIWKKEKIDLLHSYHYDKVSEKNKKIFCAISGWGIISVGIGLFITALLLAITNSALSFIAFAIGIIIGLALLIYAGKKYNA